MSNIEKFERQLTAAVTFHKHCCSGFGGENHE